MHTTSIYMDYNATTMIDPDVKREVVSSYEYFGNASSMHGLGREAAEAVRKARMQVAALLGVDAAEIVFTSGGSESNNTILNVAFSGAIGNDNRRRIITSVIEHPSIRETVFYYRDRGYPVTIIGVDPQGKLDLDALRREAGEDVALISVMTANNEIGTIQDVREISRIAKSCGALFHTDAVQAAGRIPIDLYELGVDFASISGHKFHAPKGIGALFVKKGTHVTPLIHGGEQEDGQRAGTYNTPGIVGIGAAAEKAQKSLTEEGARVASLRATLKRGIEESIPNIHINGHPEDVLPGTLNVSFPGAEGESILLYLDMEGIAVSTGSACATGSLDPSYVLLETGLGPELAHGSIRFSLGRFTTEAEVNYVLEKLPPIIRRLREMSTI